MTWWLAYEQWAWLPLVVSFANVVLFFCTVEGVRSRGLQGLKRAQAEGKVLHWTERARLSYSTRRQVLSLLVGVFVLVALGPLFFTGPLSAVPVWFNVLVAATSGGVAGFFALRRLSYSITGEKESVADDIRTYLLLLRSIAFILAWMAGWSLLGHSFYYDLGWKFLVMGAGSLFASLVVLIFADRTLGIFRRDNVLARSLQPLFSRTGVFPRRIERINVPTANAFAFPLTHSIAATRGLLEILDADEVEAVFAHELGHLCEGKRAYVRLLPYGFVGVWAFSIPWYSDALLALVLFFGGFFVSFSFSRRVALRLESQADEKAAGWVDGVVLSRALEKLHEKNLIPAVVSSKSATHPSLYDRIQKAGATPSYERPDPPSPGAPAWMLAASVLVILVAAGSGFHLPSLLGDHPSRNLFSALLTTPSGAKPIGDLALDAFHEGEHEHAIALYRRAMQVEPVSPWYPMNLAFTLAHVGRCDEAQLAYEQAWELRGNDETISKHLVGPLLCKSEK